MFSSAFFVMAPLHLYSFSVRLFLNEYLKVDQPSQSSGCLLCFRRRALHLTSGFPPLPPLNGFAVDTNVFAFFVFPALLILYLLANRFRSIHLRSHHYRSLLHHFLYCIILSPSPRRLYVRRYSLLLMCLHMVFDGSVLWIFLVVYCILSFFILYELHL